MMVADNASGTERGEQDDEAGVEDAELVEIFPDFYAIAGTDAQEMQEFLERARGASFVPLSFFDCVTDSDGHRLQPGSGARAANAILSVSPHASNVGFQIAKGVMESKGLVHLAPQTVAELQHLTPVTRGGYNLGALRGANGKIVSQVRWAPSVTGGAVALAANVMPAVAMMTLALQMNGLSSRLDSLLQGMNRVEKHLKEANRDAIIGEAQAIEDVWANVLANEGVVRHDYNAQAEAHASAMTKDLQAVRSRLAHYRARMGAQRGGDAKPVDLADEGAEIVMDLMCIARGTPAQICARHVQYLHTYQTFQAGEKDVRESLVAAQQQRLWSYTEEQLEALVGELRYFQRELHLADLRESAGTKRSRINTGLAKITNGKDVLGDMAPWLARGSRDAKDAAARRRQDALEALDRCAEQFGLRGAQGDPFAHVMAPAWHRGAGAECSPSVDGNRGSAKAVLEAGTMTSGDLSQNSGQGSVDDERTKDERLRALLASMPSLLCRQLGWILEPDECVELVMSIEVLRYSVSRKGNGCADSWLVLSSHRLFVLTEDGAARGEIDWATDRDSIQHMRLHQGTPAILYVLTHEDGWHCVLPWAGIPKEGNVDAPTDSDAKDSSGKQDKRKGETENVRLWNAALRDLVAALPL